MDVVKTLKDFTNQYVWMMFPGPINCCVLTEEKLVIH